MSHEDHIKNLIRINNRHLQKLKEQQAKFGGLFTPPYILIELEDTEAEIERLKAELREIGSSIEHEEFTQDVEANEEQYIGQRERLQTLQHPTAAQIEDLNRLMERFQEVQRQTEEKRQRSKGKSVGLKPNVEKLFVDRTAYLDNLAKYAMDDGIRLILIVGQGGMGKTALAAKFCDDIEKEGYKIQPYENLKYSENSTVIHAIVYVNKNEMLSFTVQQVFDKILQTLDKEDVDLIDDALKNPKIDVAQKTNLLLQYLQSGICLVILDNFESVLDRTNITDPDLQIFIETVCETQHDLKLIITSRTNLDIDTYAMETITLDKGLDVNHSIEFLRKLASSSIEQIINATDEELGQLSKKVHGVPMALRSLTGFLKKGRRLSIGDLLKDKILYEDFLKHDITKGLRKLIKEQYEGLPDDAKLALQVLAVYNAPVQPVAVQYIIPGMDAEAVLDILAFDFFLVQENRDYFELHPTVQEYVYEQIRDGDPFDESKNDLIKTALHAHAADFYSESKKSESKWKTITDLQPHLDEFEHRVKAEQYDQTARLLITIDSNYLQVWGYSQMVVELRQKLIGKLTDKELEVINYQSLGDVYWQIGNVIEAIPMYEKALQITRAEKYKWGEIGALIGLGTICVDFLANIPCGIEFFTQALEMAREIGDKSGEDVILANLGYTYFALATQFPNIEWKNLPIKIDFDNPLLAAIKYLEQALNNALEVDYKIGKGIRFGYLGEAYLQMYIIESSEEWLKKAIEYHEKALQSHNEIGFAQYIPKEYKRLGVDYLFASDFEKAIECFQASINNCEKALLKSELYVVLYQRAFSQLALECLTFIELNGSAFEVYQKAMAANSSEGALREQIYEVERLQRILPQVHKDFLHREKSECIETLERVLILLREKLESQRGMTNTISLPRVNPS